MPTTTAPSPKTLRRRLAERVSYEMHRHAPAPVVQAVARADYARRLFVTRHPQTFNDKVRYKMLRDHRPILGVWADKVAVREYVSRTAGADLLTKLYAVAADLGDVERAALPRNFAVKVNHACGGVVIVNDRLAPDRALPDLEAMARWSNFLVHPDALDWDRLVRAVRAWLSKTYGGGPYWEWAYTAITPKVLVEELLVTSASETPPDYKLFTFGGRVRIVQVDTDRHGEHRQNLFTPEWTPIDATLAAPPATTTPPRPATLERMVDIARRLAGDADFVRVDLYDVDGRVVFGELTSYPLAGNTRFRPERFERVVGSWWTVPDRYT